LTVRIATLAAALSLTLFTVALAADDRPRAKTHTVTMEGMRFQPEVLTVAAGDTIVWVNRDVVPHTATSDAGRFDSKEIQGGQSWRYTARSKGKFPYVCTLHPAMTALLHVK
jgi:plastocyanin